MDAITNFMGNGGIYLALALLVIAIAVTVIFPLINLFTNFAEAKKALLSVAGLIVIVLIGYALAGNDLPEFAQDAGITLGQYKMIGAIINTAIIATLIMVGYIIVDLIMGFVRS